MYSKLNEIYSKTRVDVFVMALGYLIEKGTSNIAEITDDEINEIDGNGFMTKEFSQMLVKLARDIAKATDSAVEIIQFADAKGLFEVSYYTNGEVFERETLEHTSRRLLEYILYDEIDFPNSEEEAKENLADMLEIEVEDIDKLLDY